MSDKIVYVVTTYKCSVCKYMEYILKEIQKDNPTFTITVTDFHDVPLWIKDNITLTDFPTVVFVEDNTIKYHFIGTSSKRKIIEVMKDINF